jgi:hypothetical protein
MCNCCFGAFRHISAADLQHAGCTEILGAMPTYSLSRSVMPWSGVQASNVVCARVTRDGTGVEDTIP